MIGGGQKAKVGKRPKPEGKKRFRPKNREGWARRCENGAFDTEIFRCSGLVTPVRPETPRKMKNEIFRQWPEASDWDTTRPETPRKWKIAKLDNDFLMSFFNEF